MCAFRIRPIENADASWIVDFLKERWSSTMVSRGRILFPERLPGFIAEQNGKLVGMVTYRVEGEECEIVTLDSIVEGVGIGSGLIDAIKVVAAAAKCDGIWLVTTNDNLHALGFYQKKGFALVAVHRNAIQQSRRLKPEIPLVGLHGIPIRDEIELELPLQASRRIRSGQKTLR